MPVVGTAGHVDHGKSTLVQAITGRDPDRWQEEKRRGLTIDLGFAWTDLDDGTEIAFVDVPGHERFIKNMLAGTDGLDAALLVVAADEGWMPQSEEHLGVLDLLGIDRGVVAITKLDRVDDDTAQLVALEVEDRLEGTSLSSASIVGVSAHEGTGLDELRHMLAQSIADLDLGDGDRPRLWIDRAFTISGAGTVVTGTLTGGSLAVEDQVTIFPDRAPARIRGLQSHEREHETVGPHRRVAVNLAGIDRDQVRRGAMLGRPGQWLNTASVLTRLRTVRDLPEPLTDRGAYHVHIGSGSWSIRIRLIDSPRLDGTGHALIRLPRPLPLAVGDRFIVREVGRRAVVAGGVVLDPDPSLRKAEAKPAAARLDPLVGADPDAIAEALVDIHRKRDVGELARQTRGGRARGAVEAGSMAFSRSAFEQIEADAVRLVAEYHAANPLRPGMPTASLSSALGETPAVAETLVSVSELLSSSEATVSLAGHEAGLSQADEQRWVRAEESLRQSGLSVPRASELPLDEELLHALVRQGRLVRVSADLVYLPEQVNEVMHLLGSLGKEFTVAEFRDLLSVSRKYAIPLLEWLDNEDVTQRDGDLRRLLKPSES